MIHHPFFSYFLIVSLVFLPFQTAIKCYAGSRGYINGEHKQNFVIEPCDEHMKWCIESYSDDFETVTASCQTLGTSRRLLDMCESRKPEVNSGVTKRCCMEDLCNNIGIEGMKNVSELLLENQ
uniref:Activin_recp domain-containing protein n=1 Tax=Caenorhabditis tropicalis TaxID=1561998 RepID=A0A1I7UNG9_9PELO